MDRGDGRLTPIQQRALDLTQKAGRLDFADGCKKWCARWRDDRGRQHLYFVRDRTVQSLIERGLLTRGFGGVVRLAGAGVDVRGAACAAAGG